jgi:hypothetical protein
MAIAMERAQMKLDFPPAPKLTLTGRLDPGLATEQERRGEALFFGRRSAAPATLARSTPTTRCTT